MRILTWHIHGSYLHALARIGHEWLVPVRPGRPDRFGGAGRDMPPNVLEIDADRVRYTRVDVVLFQHERNWTDDQDILSPSQRRGPRIYLEHNAPRPHPTDSRHAVDDPGVLLVHVTHFNRLMWDCGRTPTTVIEHAVAVDPSARYSGTLARGLTLVNELRRRGRVVGEDVFLAARARVPLDLAGIDSERYGGLGSLPYFELHRRMGTYRFLFSPIRYTSLPLAVIEAMTIGMPVCALATTELPTVIENGVNGYVSCDLDALLARMRDLLEDAELAARLGAAGRAVARERFSLPRFAQDWNAAFALVTSRREALAS
jgi:hypothetical protein